MKKAILYLLLILASSLYAQNDPAQNIKDLVSKDSKYLESLYLHLHQNPEVSFQEKETGKKMADELQKIGIETTSNIGGYGVVGVLKNGPGPTILVRTDTDGLPIVEETGLDYASTKTTEEGGNTVGVMHACGHDMHMTVWAGAARALTQLKSEWSGTIVFIAQPAEERGTGARKMLDEGLYQKWPTPDYALALHVSPSIAAGKVGYCPEYAMANVDMVDLEVFGEGGHGAYPHTTKDPVMLASRIVVALQTIVSRELSPFETAVVTVGSVHGGSKHNIIPNSVKLEITCRSYTDEARKDILTKIERIAKGVAMSAGVPEDKYPKMTVLDEFCPAVYNDPALAERMSNVFKQTLGAQNVTEVPPVMAGEDFSRYGRTDEQIPVFLYWLGTVSPENIAARDNDDPDRCDHYD